MPKENDPEDAQDQGGKYGGQQGMPKPEPHPAGGNDQGIVRDQRGQEQPRDKARAANEPAGSGWRCTGRVSVALHLRISIDAMEGMAGD